MSVQLPWIAICVAALASWIFGAAWFGAFGRVWAVGHGLLASKDAPRGAPPVFALVASFVAEFVMAALLAGLIAHLSGGGHALRPALLTGFFAWLAFVAPTLATNYAYQRRGFLVFAIDAGHWLGALLLQAATLSILG